MRERTGNASSVGHRKLGVTRSPSALSHSQQITQWSYLPFNLPLSHKTHYRSSSNSLFCSSELPLLSPVHLKSSEVLSHGPNPLSSSLLFQMVTRTKKIFVGGLSANTVVEDVKQYFEQFGKVRSHVPFSLWLISRRDVCIWWVTLSLNGHFQDFQTGRLKCGHLEMKDQCLPGLCRPLDVVARTFCLKLLCVINRSEHLLN